MSKEEFNIDQIVPEQVNFENELSQNIADSVLHLNAELEVSNTPFRIRVISPQSNLSTRINPKTGTVTQMVYVSEKLDERLPGFPDLRLQKKEGNGIIAQHGIRPDQPVSGMTFVLISTETNIPIAVSNFILFNPEGIKYERYVRTTTEGLEVVSFGDAFKIEDESIIVVTPGWHYVKESNRATYKMAITGMRIIDTVMSNLQSHLNANNYSAKIIVDQEGVHDALEGGTEILQKAPYDTFISKDDPTLNMEFQLASEKNKEEMINIKTNLYDVIEFPIRTAKAIASGVLRKGLSIMPGISHMYSYGPVFIGDINDWVNSKES